MTEDELVHEELLRLFRDYYKANLDWKTKHTRKAAIETRNCLSKIRELALERRKLIQQWQHDENAIKWKHKNNPTGSGSVVAGKKL